MTTLIQETVEAVFSEMTFSEVLRIIRKRDRAILTLGASSYMVGCFFESMSSDCHVLIGKYTALADKLTLLLSCNHHKDYASNYPFEAVYKDNMPLPPGEQNTHINIQNFMRGGQILIGNDVWLGTGVTVLGGVRIGNGAVIGANAVVAKDVPPYAVVVGNPARVIKYRFDAETIARLQRIRWWDWEEKTIRARYKEMKDAPRFARKYDLPLPTLVDQWPELGEAKRDGLKVYGFIPDFQNETERVWEHVLQKYMQDVSSDDPMLLVLFLENGQPNAQQLRLLERWIRARGEHAPRLLAYDPQGARDFSFMREVDAFITTKEDVTTRALDALEAYGNSGAQVLYGMDAKIFVQK